MDGAVALIVNLIVLVLAIVTIAGVWKTFKKANEPGWACLVPIYNIIVMLKIAGKPIWWIVLLIIPVVSIVAAILVMISLAKSFGKGAGFGIGLAIPFVNFIFWPMLGFGDAKYQGPAG